jgi:hypothetical protein
VRSLRLAFKQNRESHFTIYVGRRFLALIFLLRRRWTALATLMSVSILLPTFDAGVLKQQLGAAAPLTFHVGTAVALSAPAILLWIRVINDRRENQ